MLAINPQQLTLKNCIVRYFETLNAGEFYETALLFTESGQLAPPFDDIVHGQDAIAHYLAQEAVGMKFFAREIQVKSPRRVTAHGYVETPWFTVNTVWYFEFDAIHKLSRVEIKLQAHPEELLSWQRFIEPAF